MSVFGSSVVFMDEREPGTAAPAQQQGFCSCLRNDWMQRQKYKTVHEKLRKSIIIWEQDMN